MAVAYLTVSHVQYHLLHQVCVGVQARRIQTHELALSGSFR
jgi:hypothetical protein